MPSHHPQMLWPLPWQSSQMVVSVAAWEVAADAAMMPTAIKQAVKTFFIWLAIFFIIFFIIDTPFWCVCFLSGLSIAGAERGF